MLFFGASLNAIPWCYAPEILPLKARSQGTSLAVMFNWVSVSYLKHVIFELKPDSNRETGLHYCHGYAYHDCQLSLEDISRLHVMRKPNRFSNLAAYFKNIYADSKIELRHCTTHLLLLPRNRRPLARADRLHLHQGRRSGHRRFRLSLR